MNAQLKLEGIREIDILVTAKTVYGEARGESEAGRRAVAWVIRNRAAIGKRHPHFGDGTAASACLQPWQFSCWNHNDPNFEILEGMEEDDDRLLPFIEMAKEVLEGKGRDPTHGATYYHTQNVGPKWARGQKPCAAIGHHKFYKDIA